MSADFEPLDLYYVEDELGNDLVLLGLVNKDGVSTVSADGTIEVHRSSSSKKGNGVLKATDLTSLFQWSGDVCYLQSDTSAYCLVDTVNVCSDRSLCCTDTDSNSVYESCTAAPLEGGCAETDEFGNTLYTVTASCREFQNEWIFNIGDYVGALWPVYSNGAYNINVRIYPM